jgi:hypothetical protein
MIRGCPEMVIRQMEPNYVLLSTPKDLDIL